MRAEISGSQPRIHVWEAVGARCGPGGTAIVTNVHGHRPDSTSTVDIVEVLEELVQISVLTGPPGARSGAQT